MAIDLLPAGGAIGMVKRVKPEWGLKGFTDDMIRGFHNKRGDVYDEAFSPKEAFDEAMKQASKKEAAVLRALEKDDFLGFDYPHQALRAVLENPENFDISPVLKTQLTKLGNLDPVKKQSDDFFGMHKSTDLGDIVLTKSAKDAAKYQMTFFDGKIGQSNLVRDMQFDTREEAIKAFEDLQ